MITPGCHLQQSIHTHPGRIALSEGTKRELTYQQLGELAAGFAPAIQRAARLNNIVLIHTADRARRMAAVAAALEQGAPFFLNDPDRMSAREAAAFLPGGVWVLGEAASDIRPVAGEAASREEHPLWYLFCAGDNSLFEVKGLHAAPAARLLQNRITQLGLTAESGLLFLPGALQPGDPAPLLATLLCGGCWIAASEEDRTLDLLSGRAVTHLEGTPGQVEAFLSLCGSDETAALRCVVFHGPAPGTELTGYLHRTLPKVRLLRSAPAAPAGFLPCGPVQSSDGSERIWLHGLSLSVTGYERLCGALPGVQSACVTAVGDGPPECFLLPGRDFDTGNFSRELRRRLPSFLCPRAWYLLDGRTPLPSHKEPGRLREISAPLRLPDDGDTDAVTRAVLDIWADVLQLGFLHPQDSFLRLGGGSYQMTQVYARIRRVFPVKIQLTDLYRHIRASSLSAFLTAQMKQQGTFESFLRKAADSR